MKKNQTGVSLVAVMVIMGVLGAAAVFALISMRNERNLFAEGLNKVEAKAKEVAAPMAASPEPVRKCVIKGKTVISNTDCGNQGKIIEIHDTKGFEAPKPAAEPMPTASERAIQRATQ